MNRSLTLAERMQVEEDDIDFSSCLFDDVPTDIPTETPTDTDISSIDEFLQMDKENAHPPIPREESPVSEDLILPRMKDKKKKKRSSQLEAYFDKQQKLSSQHNERIGREEDVEVERSHEKAKKKPNKKNKLEKLEKAVGLKAKVQRHERVLREIFEQKLSENFAIPSHTFEQVVQGIMEEKFPGIQIKSKAVEALQRESEMMVTKMFRLGWHLTAHGRRKTLRREDLFEVQDLCGINKDGCSFLF